MRVYIQSFPQGRFPIPDYCAHHLQNVMRVKDGAVILIFNERQGEFEAVIRGRNIVPTKQIKQGISRPGAQEFSRKYYLAFSPLKNQHLVHFIIEKATELGVTNIQPMIMERTQGHRSGDINIEKWRKIAINAAEQCERLSIPEVAAPVALRDFVDELTSQAAYDSRAVNGHAEKDGEPVRPAEMVWLWCVERSSGTSGETSGGEPRDVFSAVNSFGIADVIKKNVFPAHKAVGLIIGPEGGFSEQDRRLLETKENVHKVSLGNLVLRSETAAICALANVMALVEWERD
ncbi:MAG: 16S rRNA (uracil(1498)-N(3))-methyltransferase [Holosporales bacterium]|jgi:16S rRNA (uracil1498-N3)-methyltransferase|nr:16S rRNA (uracil(1498)-N(3))-methyltransferase [Holosporales bacterium]